MDNDENKEAEEEKDEIVEDIMQDESARDLIANLDQCYEECVSGITHCLDQGGDFVEKDHLRWLMDCADICKIAQNFFLRDSEYAGDMLSLCAFICDDCAESCEKFFNDQKMKDCAMACRNCADVCRNMIDLEEEEEK
ncbi:MAG: four-helix bundle copper-binding protein [Patescibacteria group bacterium]